MKEAFNGSMTRYIPESEIAKILSYALLIPAMERALADLSAGKVIQPPRNMITIEEKQRILGIMPAVAPAGMGAKLVSVYPKNEGTKHPTHLAVIALFDPQTGAPLAFMDGTLITEMRTAAVSAAITRQAATENPKVLAIIGSGVQATSHLEALRHLYQFSDIRIASRNPENARNFAQHHGITATDIESAVRGADIVVTATSALHPVLRGAWLKPGAHVNAVGAPFPTWRELDDDVMQNLIIADSREACLRESGDVILSGAKIFAEAGEIFSGKVKVDRSTTTVFKSVGLAVEDIAAARIVYDAWGNA